jgi:hypothetical protein
VDDKHRLIQCGDHKWAPCSIVCKCLADNPARKDWNPVEPAVPGDPLDWACNECVKHLDKPDLDRLALVCMHCVKRLRHRAGLPNVGDQIMIRPNEEDAPDVKGEVHDINPEGYVVLCDGVQFQIEPKEVLTILK